MVWIRNLTPFFLLFASLISVLLSYFEFYNKYNFAIYYIGNFTGFSIVTDIFMYSVYMNRKYCTSTKVAVIGLFALNITSMLCTFFNQKTDYYDIAILFITFTILVILKGKKNENAR